MVFAKLMAEIGLSTSYVGLWYSFVVTPTWKVSQPERTTLIDNIIKLFAEDILSLSLYAAVAKVIMSRTWGATCEQLKSLPLPSELIDEIFEIKKMLYTH